MGFLVHSPVEAHNGQYGVESRHIFSVPGMHFMPSHTVPTLHLHNSSIPNMQKLELSEHSESGATHLRPLHTVPTLHLHGFKALEAHNQFVLEHS